MLLGKGAMNEFGVFAQGHNAHAGTTLNPHCYTKSAGGSSSGCGAALAVGLCPIAVGADGGGSIRIPSSMCGVVGLKPTQGRLADDHGGSYSRHHSAMLHEAGRHGMAWQLAGFCEQEGAEDGSITLHAPHECFACAALPPALSTFVATKVYGFCSWSCC